MPPFAPPPPPPPPNTPPYLRSLYTCCSNSVEHLYEGQVGVGSFVPWREVVLFSEVTNVLIAMEVGWLHCPWREVVLFSEVTNVLIAMEVGGGGGGSSFQRLHCPLERGCPLLGGYKWVLVAVLFSEAPLSLGERLSSSRRLQMGFSGCPLFRGSIVPWREVVLFSEVMILCLVVVRGFTIRD